MKIKGHEKRMIIRDAPQIPVIAGKNSSAERVLSWTENDRTAGKIPVWEKPAIGEAQYTGQTTETQSLSYGPQPQRPDKKPDEAFGFGDLIDIVNPLQHIPLVSYIYREITGDKIRSSGEIIGGALYGGFIGVGAGIANAIIREETGSDATGNAMNMVSGKNAFAAKAAHQYTIAAYNAAKPRYNE